jgi:NAD(P)-dependent dehydrogenase (short-subunit alcohol dehydrogenase family)
MQPSRFLVTGGSQGIGAAIVEQARNAGHQVVSTGRNKELIDAMARKTGAVGLQADVSVPEETREPWTRATNEWVASKARWTSRK